MDITNFFFHAKPFCPARHTMRRGHLCSSANDGAAGGCAWITFDADRFGSYLVFAASNFVVVAMVFELALSLPR